MSGLVIPSLSEFSSDFCDPHKVFGIVNKAEIGFVLEVFWFFDDPADVGNLISGSSAVSNHLEHMEVHGSHIAEGWFGEF